MITSYTELQSLPEVEQLLCFALDSSFWLHGGYELPPMEHIKLHSQNTTQNTEQLRFKVTISNVFFTASLIPQMILIRFSFLFSSSNIGKYVDHISMIDNSIINCATCTIRTFYSKIILVAIFSPITSFSIINIQISLLLLEWDLCLNSMLHDGERNSLIL